MFLHTCIYEDDQFYHMQAGSYYLYQRVPNTLIEPTYASTKQQEDMIGET